MGMWYFLKEQGNVFALVQIFNAIPSPNFSALWNSARLFVLVSRLSSAIPRPLQLIKPCSNSPRGRLRRLPSNFGSGRLNLQCRFDLSLLLYSNFISYYAGTKQVNKKRN